MGSYLSEHVNDFKHETTTLEESVVTDKVETILPRHDLSEFDSMYVLCKRVIQRN